MGLLALFFIHGNNHNLSVKKRTFNLGPYFYLVSLNFVPIFVPFVPILAKCMKLYAKYKNINGYSDRL